MTTPAPLSATVQHVPKKSSDQLLSKFAELGSDDHKKKRRKKSHCETPSAALVERRSLLPPAVTRRSALLRQLGIGRARLKARDLRNKSLFGTIQKTWRRTIEGASRAFMEKHYHRHKRLINDID